MKTCECGCGTELTNGKRFVNFHQNRRNSHPNWKGGERTIGNRVFILDWNHPKHNRRGYVRRAWIVIENHLGRKLLPEEVVHHIDGNPLNDSLENLTVMNRVEHLVLHSVGKENTSYRRDIDTIKNILPLKYAGHSTIEISKLLSCSKSLIVKRLRAHKKNTD